MKKILIIILLFIAFNGYGQGGWTRPNTSYGNRQFRIALDSTFNLPTGVAAPDLHAYDLGQSALYYRRFFGLYVYDPDTQTWSLVGSGGGGGSQDLQSVLTVGNTANIGIQLTTHEGLEVTDSLDANSYAHLKVQENINGGYLELQNVNSFHGTLYAGDITSNQGYQLANTSGYIPMTVSVNGGTPVVSNANGNIDLTVSGGSSSSIILDSVIVDFDGLHPVVSVPISAGSAKNIDISPEANAVDGFKYGWNASQAVLKYQTAIKGTYKFYITYYQ